MLVLDNVSAGYGGKDVISGISMNISRGYLLSIIGPNGCGKSTLLKAISGLIPYEGIIELDGKPLLKMKRRQIAAKVAMLSQMSPLYFSYSVYDTVMMGRYLHSKGMLNAPSSADKEMVENCLKAVDLLKVKDKDITKLSGGQLQRVFLARTLAQDPSIILLDEPTNHLDLKYQIELIDHLKIWAKENDRAVIGVLHDINQAISLGDDIFVMQSGKSVAHGFAADIITGDLLHTVYDIDVTTYMRKMMDMWR